ncbi:MAG: ATP-dependent helicase [Cyanophyceae cyanobacterium]
MAENQKVAWDTEAWRSLRATLRPGQRAMADWTGGPLAVSAVPGAGKSTGMARAAALAIAKFQLHSAKKLVVVTFTRSAAANLKQKIRAALVELNVPVQGFMVSTLHGLAFQIVGRSRDLAGLDPQASLVVPSLDHRLIRDSVDRWIERNPMAFQQLIEGNGFDGEEAERLRRWSVLRTAVLPNMALTAIHEAKSSGLLPDDLYKLSQLKVDSGRVDDFVVAYDGLAIAAGLYEEYERLLRSRNLMDYDDAILGALRVLEDPQLRSRWQSQIFGVFEDEAQDSSPLQNRLISILATLPPYQGGTEGGSSETQALTKDSGKGGDSLGSPHPPLIRGAFAGDDLNLIRVGDPNQAINSTFTPADPIFFRRFCQRCGDRDSLAEMNQSGRSSEVLIKAANFALNWINQKFAEDNPAYYNDEPKPAIALPFLPQTIYPVASDDPQPDANPDPLGPGLEIDRPDTIHDTAENIARRALRLFKKYPSYSAAVLVRTNDQGRFLAETFEDRYGDRLPVYEVGRSDRQSHVPGELLRLLRFIERPHSPDNLKAALKVLGDRKLIESQDLDRLASRPEGFLYPSPLEPRHSDRRRQAQKICTALLRARLALTPYNLISFVCFTLGYDPTELATAEKLIDELRQRGAGDGRLGTILQHLSPLVANETFTPVDAEGTAESAYMRSGQLTIITMHKAKGLDWDAVFIPFLQANNIPGKPNPPLPANFLGEIDLAECIRAQLRTYIQNPEVQVLPALEEAWREANQLKLAENYRLLYVALTRAKRYLYLAAEHQAPFSWNNLDNLQGMQSCPLVQPLEREFGC